MRFFVMVIEGVWVMALWLGSALYVVALLAAVCATVGGVIGLLGGAAVMVFRWLTT